MLATLLIIAGLVVAVAIQLLLVQKQINGTVRDSVSGKVIPAATLEIANIRIETDKNGRFSVPLNQNKDVRVQALADGYLPAAFSFDVPWYMKTGQIHVDLMPLGFSVRVIDASTGEPVPDATVYFGSDGYPVDENGYREWMPFTQAPPIPITVESPGYEDWQRILRRMPQDSSELPLTVTLEPHIFSGKVIAADTAEPLAGVLIEVGDATTTTDAHGVFRLARTPVGAKISIHPNDTFFPTEITFNGESEREIKLMPRSLQVQIVDALTGEPISGAELTLAGQKTETNRQGIAKFERVPQQGTVIAGHPAYAAQTLRYVDQPAVAIKLRPNSIQGVIRDAATGEPLPKTEIAFNGKIITANENAEFLLPDLSRPVSITLKAMGYRPGELSTTPTAKSIAVNEKFVKTQPCQTPQTTSSAALCIDFLMEPFNPKGIYIPFSLLSRPDIVIDLMNMVARTELNAVVVDVKSDRGSLAWDSNVPLANTLGVDGNREGWMTLEEFIAEAQARDIYTIARMVIFKDNPLAFGKPELAATYGDGSIWVDGEGLAWANPFESAVWDYNIALAKEVAAIGFDEINMDYLRFPSDGDIGSIVYAQENTAETRTTAIRTFVSRMREALRPYEVFLSADVFGLTVWVDPDSDMNIGQRVKDIAPYVDYLAPMIYPSTFIPGNLGLDDPSAYPYQVIYRSQIAAMERVAAPTKVRPWLQAYWYSPYEMLLQKQAANDAGSAGWIWWNAGGVYDEGIFVP